jgi:hypothetical protein
MHACAGVRESVLQLGSANIEIGLEDVECLSKHMRDAMESHDKTFQLPPMTTWLAYPILQDVEGLQRSIDSLTADQRKQPAVGDGLRVLLPLKTPARKKASSYLASLIMPALQACFPGVHLDDCILVACKPNASMQFVHQDFPTMDPLLPMPPISIDPLDAVCPSAFPISVLVPLQTPLQTALWPCSHLADADWTKIEPVIANTPVGSALIMHGNMLHCGQDCPAKAHPQGDVRAFFYGLCAAHPLQPEDTFLPIGAESYCHYLMSCLPELLACAPTSEPARIKLQLLLTLSKERWKKDTRVTKSVSYSLLYKSM